MAYPVAADYPTRVRKPADFDQFWQDVTNQAAQIQLEPDTISEPLRSSADLEVYQVFFNSIDNVRIAGWYCLPSNRSEPLPSVIVVPGYQSDPAIPKNWAKLGYAALAVAPRGKLRSKSQFDPGYPGLLTYGIVDRNVYSYRGFYVDAWRAVDFLLGRDEVDASRIGITGSSQGGGLTLCTAAMRPEIRGGGWRSLSHRIHRRYRTDAYLSIRRDKRLSETPSRKPRGCQRDAGIFRLHQLR